LPDKLTDDVLELEALPADPVVWRLLDLDRLETEAQDRIRQMTAAGRKDVVNTYSNYAVEQITNYYRDLRESREALRDALAADLLVEAKSRLDTVYGGRDGTYVRKTLAYKVFDGEFDAPETDEG
jgi:hypothetical protein